MRASEIIFRRQRGVAVVTALLLTTLSVALVASLFRHQHVQVRLIENQQQQLQLQWLEHAIFDWANMVLRDDAAASNADHPDEAWSQPLIGSHLDGANREARAGADVRLLGRIVDAQSRYNLRNLAPQGMIDPREVAVLQRLLQHLRIDPRLAHQVATQVAAQAATSHPQAETARRRQRFLAIDRLEDLFELQAMSPAALATLSQHVVLLPIPTPVNVNTASDAVLAARFDRLPATALAHLLATRRQAHIRDAADLALRLSQNADLPPANLISISSNYFLVSASVEAGRSRLNSQALIERHLMTGSRLLWRRDG